MRRCVLAAWVLAVVGCSLPPRSAAADVTIEPIAGPVVLDYDESRLDWWMVARVVDALTGAPLAGARLHQANERNEPEGGVFFRDATWVADEFGFVRMPPSVRRSGWFIVEHDGYGPVAEMSSLTSVVSLMPGIDVPVRVVDAFDRPIAGAGVGLCLGCGHTPDVRIATADARGEAVLRCIEPTTRVTTESDIRDVYVRAPGFGPYYEDSKWRLGDPPLVARPEFIPVVRGRVVGPTGVPVAGVAIGGSLHRGPWTWSSADGTFCHVGRESRGDWLQVRVQGREFQLRPPVDERPLEVALPAATLGERPHGRVRVVVRDAATDAPVPNAHIEAWVAGLVHPGDPLAGDSTDEQGICTVPAPAGRVDAHVHDAGEVPAFDPVATTVEVKADADSEATLRVVRRPVRLVTVIGAWEDLALVTAAEGVKVTTLVQQGIAVPLPAQGPFALVLDLGWRRSERRFFFASLPDGPISLRAFAPTRVSMRLVDEQGKPVAARAAIEEQPGSWDDATWHTAGTDGVVVVPTDLVGCALLRVEPTDDHRPRTLHLSLPQRNDEVVHTLGEVVLRSTAQSPQLRLVDASGSPVSANLQVMRPGLVVESLPVGADGAFDALDLLSGDRLDCDANGQPRCSMLWTGQATWTLPAGAGITLEVVDAADLKPRDPVALCGERAYHEYEGSLVLDNLPSGAVEFFVGARGCDSARVTLRLAPGERRHVRVTLRRA